MRFLSLLCAQRPGFKFHHRCNFPYKRDFVTLSVCVLDYFSYVKYEDMLDLLSIQIDKYSELVYTVVFELLAIRTKL